MDGVYAASRVCLLIISFVSLFQSTSSLNMPPMDDGSNQKRHTSNFQAKQNHPTSYEESPAFRGPIVLDSTSTSTQDFHVRLKNYYEENNLEIQPVQPLTPSATTLDTSTILKAIANHLAYQDAPVDVKEVTESMEFYLRIRKRMLGSAKKALAAQQKDLSRNQNNNQGVITVYDLCCGHGLTGMLFAACNPPSQNKGTRIQTVLVDQTVPSSHLVLRNLITEVCPWMMQSINFVTTPLDSFQPTTIDTSNIAVSASTCIVISTHACGTLTDDVLKFAIASNACGMAVMPCCYTGTDRGAPYGVKRALGVAWAADIRRSFYLMEHGYHADFSTIPKQVTPMNRIIVGEKKKHT